eukprot:GHVT01006558.1.p2 GENE.GHVT01006558.1~~GHVT01006558.1.p2  ORF type:complete len:113 (+),score=0.38 GHVT01006558.1:29-367(+)
MFIKITIIAAVLSCARNEDVESTINTTNTQWSAEDYEMNFTGQTTTDLVSTENLTTERNRSGRSSADEWPADHSLYKAASAIFRFGQPIITIVGILGNTLNIIVFTSRKFRR